MILYKAKVNHWLMTQLTSYLFKSTRLYSTTTISVSVSL